jgi:hypothetical protein
LLLPVPPSVPASTALSLHSTAQPPYACGGAGGRPHCRNSEGDPRLHLSPRRSPSVHPPHRCRPRPRCRCRRFWGWGDRPLPASPLLPNAKNPMFMIHSFPTSIATTPIYKSSQLFVLLVNY